MPFTYDFSLCANVGNSAVSEPQKILDFVLFIGLTICHICTMRVSNCALGYNNVFIVVVLTQIGFASRIIKRLLYVYSKYIISLYLLATKLVLLLFDKI